MKITDLLVKEGIELNGQAESKKEAIDKMVDLMAATGKLADREAYKAQVLRRKELRESEKESPFPMENVMR